MSNMNVTYAEMKTAAGRLRQGQEDMNVRLVELGALIDGLVQEGFVTQYASGTYQAQFQQFHTGAKSTIDALEGLSRYLEQAAESLEQTDQSLANSIKG